MAPRKTVWAREVPGGEQSLAYLISMDDDGDDSNVLIQWDGYKEIVSLPKSHVTLELPPRLSRYNNTQQMQNNIETLTRGNGRSDSSYSTSSSSSDEEAEWDWDQAEECAHDHCESESNIGKENIVQNIESKVEAKVEETKNNYSGAEDRGDDVDVHGCGSASSSSDAVHNGSLYSQVKLEEDDQGAHNINNVHNNGSFTSRVKLEEEDANEQQGSHHNIMRVGVKEEEEDTDDEAFFGYSHNAGNGVADNDDANNANNADDDEATIVGNYGTSVNHNGGNGDADAHDDADTIVNVYRPPTMQPGKDTTRAKDETPPTNDGKKKREIKKASTSEIPKPAPCSSDRNPTRYNENDIFLSLKEERYKSIMHTLFRKLGPTTTTASHQMTEKDKMISGEIRRKNNKIAAQRVFQMLKNDNEKGGRFFKLKLLKNNNVKGGRFCKLKHRSKSSYQFVQVDENTALDKIRKDIINRMATSSRWLLEEKSEEEDTCKEEEKEDLFTSSSIPLVPRKKYRNRKLDVTSERSRVVVQNENDVSASEKDDASVFRKREEKQLESGEKTTSPPKKRCPRKFTFASVPRSKNQTQKVDAPIEKRRVGVQNENDVSPSEKDVASGFRKHQKRQLESGEKTTSPPKKRCPRKFKFASVPRNKNQSQKVDAPIEKRRVGMQNENDVSPSEKDVASGFRKHQKRQLESGEKTPSPPKKSPRKKRAASQKQQRTMDDTTLVTFHCHVCSKDFEFSCSNDAIAHFGEHTRACRQKMKNSQGRPQYEILQSRDFVGAENETERDQNSMMTTQQPSLTLPSPKLNSVKSCGVTSGQNNTRLNTTTKSDVPNIDVESEENGSEPLYSEPIPCDPDELEAGSRVVVLCSEEKRWQATVRRHHKKNGHEGFKIHYDGMKRLSVDWVPVKSVLGLIASASDSVNESGESHNTSNYIAQDAEEEDLSDAHDKLFGEDENTKLSNIPLTSLKSMEQCGVDEPPRLNLAHDEAITSSQGYPRFLKSAASDKSFPSANSQKIPSKVAGGDILQRIIDDNPQKKWEQCNQIVGMSSSLADPKSVRTETESLQSNMIFDDKAELHLQKKSERYLTPKLSSGDSAMSADSSQKSLLETASFDKAASQETNGNPAKSGMESNNHAILHSRTSSQINEQIGCELKTASASSLINHGNSTSIQNKDGLNERRTSSDFFARLVKSIAKPVTASNGKEEHDPHSLQQRQTLLAHNDENGFSPKQICCGHTQQTILDDEGDKHLMHQSVKNELSSVAKDSNILTGYIIPRNKRELLYEHCDEQKSMQLEPIFDITSPLAEDCTESDDSLPFAGMQNGQSGKNEIRNSKEVAVSHHRDCIRGNVSSLDDANKMCISFGPRDNINCETSPVCQLFNDDTNKDNDAGESDFEMPECWLSDNDGESTADCDESDLQHAKSIATWAARPIKKEHFGRTVETASDFIRVPLPEPLFPCCQFATVYSEDSDSDHQSTAFRQRITPLKEYLDAEEKKSAKERLALMPELDDAAMDLLAALESGDDGNPVYSDNESGETMIDLVCELNYV